jgi:hypothetical protein
MLNHWAKMARMHWKEHLPKYYESLQKQGILEQELEKAGNQASDMIGELGESGLHRNEVLEIVLPQLILLPPEKDQEPIPQE